MKRKKELGIDSNGVQLTMRGYHFLGDGTAQIGLNVITTLIGMLTYFYTDKVGLSAAVAGTVLLVAKVLDAFTDLIMGRIIDITKSKYGKVRPWFLWMIVPTIFSIISLFTVPNLGAGAKTAYALITNIIATAIVFTAIAIPYGSLMAVRTQSTIERSKMGITRAVFGYFTGMVIVIGLIPITNALGGDQGAWITVATVFAILSGISLFITFLVSKEQNSGAVLSDKSKDENSLKFKESITLLFSNKYWVITLFIQLLINIMYSISGATGIYYAKYILQNENLVALFGAVGLIPVFLGFGITGPMIKKFGLTKTTQIAFVIGIVANAIRIFFPYSLLAALILGSFSVFATIPMMAVGGVLVNNTIEYGEWKYGKRIVGMTNSASSFGSKVGSGLGAAMIGWILAFGNYDGSLAVQLPSAINSILALTIYIPLAILIGLYFITKQYDLDEKYPQIIKELNLRKENAN
jgi:sugar (glycoside-pentoside-hexuronide) transporter